MELLYVWIKKHGIIEGEGFNFSGKIRFHYDKNEETLTITENKNYLDMFFEECPTDTAKLVNVTAIIGANGTGKSTLLQFVAGNFSTGRGGCNIPAIIVFAEGDDRYIYHHPSITVRENNHTEFKFKKKEIAKDNVVGWDVCRDIDELKRTSFIMFSNIFEANQGKFDGKNLHNISTTHLIRADRNDAIESKRYDNLASEVSVHGVCEIERQIHFIKEFEGAMKELPFALPDKLVILPGELAFDINNISERDERNFASYNNVMVSIDNKRRNIRNNDNGNSLKNKFYDRIFNIFLYELIERTMGTGTSIKLTEEKMKFLTCLDNQIGELLNVKDIFKKIHEINKDDKKSQLYIHVEKITDIISLIETIEKLFDDVNTDIQEDNGSIEVRLLQGEQVNEIITAAKKAMMFIPLIRFSWRNLCSGENAMLNIYSRFYSLKNKKYGTRLALHNDVVVLIDEGEVYLHPMWQKQFLYSLMKFLCQVYSTNRNIRNIQIILTSHSPFVASDLPLSNVVFLKKEGNQSIVVDGLEEKRQTFASNIHTLLADSFFMENGFIGDYAKHKINHLIKVVMESSAEQLRGKKEYIRKSIDMIGEPVIRNKLQSMLKDKLSTDIISIDEKIESLQSQIDELKRGRE